MYLAAAKSLQSCPTLCNPIDSSPPGSPVPEILQARTLEWVDIFCMKVKSLSRVRPLAWTAAYQAPPSMGFSRPEYWSGVPFPSPMYLIFIQFSREASKFLKKSIFYAFLNFCKCFLPFKFSLYSRHSWVTP